MLVDIGDLIWGAIGFATLALVITLVAVAWEVRHVLRVAATFASQLNQDVSPMLQDMQHIVHRLDSVTAKVGEKAEQAGALVERVEESFSAGRLRARDAWDDTRVWLDSLKVGWQAGWQVFREGAGEAERPAGPQPQRAQAPQPAAAEAAGEPAPEIEPTPVMVMVSETVIVEERLPPASSAD
jgi:hypothetical protein